MSATPVSASKFVLVTQDMVSSRYTNRQATISPPRLRASTMDRFARL
jgi:hypothetical protein